MTMYAASYAVAQLSGLLFIVSSMLAMGMSLLLVEILAPLRNARLVIPALLANFVLVPLWAYLVTRLVPLAQPLQIGLIVLSTAAGAPFLPKLVQVARGNIGFGVGLMVLLMVFSVGYMPFVLPLLLPGVSVNPWDIAKSLLVLMLVPLTIGLLIRARLPEVAARWRLIMNRLSNVAILILLVVGLGLNISNLIELSGSGGVVALLVFIVGSLLIGLLVGSRDRGMRSVMALGTAQRNVSAAVLVSVQNFPGTMTLPFVLGAAVVFLLTLLPLARLIGARAQSPASRHEATEPQGG